MMYHCYMHRRSWWEKILLWFLPTKNSQHFGYNPKEDCTIYYKTLFGRIYIVGEAHNKYPD